MPKVRVVPDKGGFKKFIKSEEIFDILEDKAEAVISRNDGNFEARKWKERERAVVNIVDPYPGAIGREARSGNLAKISRTKAE